MSEHMPSPQENIENKLQELMRIFEGKRVKITHTGNPSLKNIEGTCKTLHITEGGIDMELTDGQRIGFSPGTISDTSVECDMRHAMIAGTRKIELAE